RRVRAAVCARGEAPHRGRASRQEQAQRHLARSWRGHVTQSVVDARADDLFELTTALVAVRSESHHEAELADLVEARLRERAPSLAIDRIDENIVVRTELG